MLELLRDYPNFSFRNYSVPEIDKIDANTDEELERALREDQIKPATIVVLLGGMYVAHSKWIKKETTLAEIDGKPILGVKPHGNERMPSFVEDHADQTVGWRGKSVVDGIRDLTN